MADGPRCANCGVPLPPDFPEPVCEQCWEMEREKDAYEREVREWEYREWMRQNG